MKYFSPMCKFKPAKDFLSFNPVPRNPRSELILRRGEGGG